MSSEISLSVREAKDLFGLSIRIDQTDMRLLKILPGDAVAVTGNKTCYATAMPSLMEDRNQGIVRISALVRRNAGAVEAGTLKISALENKPEIAESITLEITNDIDYLSVSAKTSLLATAWSGRVVIANNTMPVPTLDLNSLEARIVDTVPSGAVKISNFTSFIINRPANGFSAIGLAGLRDPYLTCCTIAEKRLHDDLASCARSVLLIGPAGCGKAQMVKRLAEDMKANLRIIDAHELLDRHASLGNTDLENLFSDITRLAPVILLFNNLEALNNHPEQHNVTSQICSLLDDLHTHKKVLLFGACSGEVVPRLVADKRFDLIMPIDAPDRFARQEMLVLATRDMPIDETVNLQQLAEFTKGYTAADLRRLATAANVCGRKPLICQNDFTDALRTIQPSALTEVYSDIPNVSWNDVGGLEDVKALLQETLSWSLQFKSQFTEANVQPPRSILISGSQGAGKTLITRAAAGTIPLHYIEIPCPSLATKDRKEANEIIHNSFALAKRKSPCIIFFDDIEALFRKTTSIEEPHTPNPVVFQLLSEIDSLPHMAGVFVIAATSRPDFLTNDMMRPGRFDYAIMIPQPDATARKKILQIHTNKLPLAADVDFDKLSDMMQGMSASDITTLCNRVGLLALRQSFNIEGGTLPPVVNLALFEQVLRGKKT